jgi:hypothetical protein
MAQEIDARVFSAMQTGVPYKTYIKTVLGKVYVTILEPFSGQPTGYILEGNPRRNNEGCILKIWSEPQDMFFRTTNKRYFENGTIIDYVAPVEEEKEKPIESYTDDELKVVINQKYFALEKTLNNTKNEAVLFRMKTLAKEMEKSEKIVQAITARLSEVQTLKPVPTEDGEDYS